MTKPHPVSSTTLRADRPGRLIMLRSLEPRVDSRLLLLLLLLLLLIYSAESKPHMAHEGAPGVYSERIQLLEAVKKAILSSLGMDAEPRLTQRASEEELRDMYRLYSDTLREMRGNSSQGARGTRQNTTATVLSPVTVKLLRVVQRGRHTQSGHLMLWYRAVFHKTPDLQTRLTLARAELKISRQVLDRLTLRREVKVRVNGMKTINAAALTNADQPDASKTRTQETTLDIRPEVQAWMRASGSLVVDVGIAVRRRDIPTQNPAISLELGLAEQEPARRTRVPRSNKEDECNEHGWCCRKSIVVSFKDIGWTDWVVAPAEYTMHFCDGTCPHNYKPASMHTQVKSRMHQLTKGETPEPCCVPAAYEPMVLMHYDSRGMLKLTPFDDLIVTDCHCA